MRSSPFEAQGKGAGPLLGRLVQNGFDGKVGAELLEGAEAQVVERNFWQMCERDSCHSGKFGGIEENEIVDEAGRERRAVQMGAGFEKDTQDLAVTELFQHGVEIDLTGARF